MARAFCTFGVVILLAAFVLQLLVSISLPFLPTFDIVRTNFDSDDISIGRTNNTISQLRLGIWGYCEKDLDTDVMSCENTGHGYAVVLKGPWPTRSHSTVIRSSWTRGLAVHPLAAIVTLVALILSFSTHLTVTLLASITSFFAAVLTLIAFAIDIALLALARTALSSFSTAPGPGFWITLATLILLLLGGCTVCFGRRRDRAAATATTAAATTTTTTTYPEKPRPFWRRWLRRY